MPDEHPSSPVAMDVLQCPKCDHPTSFSTRDELRGHLICVHFFKSLEAFLDAGAECVLCSRDNASVDSGQGDSPPPSPITFATASKLDMVRHVALAHGQLERLLTESELFALYGFPRQSGNAALVLRRERVPISGTVIVLPSDPDLAACPPKCPHCGRDVPPARRPMHVAKHMFNRLCYQLDLRTKQCPHCDRSPLSKTDDLVFHVAIDHKKILEQFERNKDEMEEYIFSGGNSQ
jgi:hypothetical protein